MLTLPILTPIHIRIGLPILPYYTMYTSRHHFYKRRWRCKHQLAEPPRPKSAQNWHFKQVFGRILTNTLVVRWVRPRKNISGLLQGKLYTYVYVYIYICTNYSTHISGLFPTLTTHMYSNFEYFAWRICALFGLVPLIPSQYFNQWFLLRFKGGCWVDPLGDLLFFGHLGYLFDGCRVLSFAFGTGKQLWVARLGKGGEGQKSAGKWWRAMILVEMINGNHPFWENFKMCHRKPVEYFHDICGLSGYAK